MITVPVQIKTFGVLKNKNTKSGIELMTEAFKALEKNNKIGLKECNSIVQTKQNK